jgi:hypothetical protein
MPYYLDAPSLGSATAVYTDAALTICAPDGFYSDTLIVRELVGCVLQPQQICKSCGVACGTECSNTELKTGVYQVTIDLGNDPTSIGAVIVKFDPQSFPKGIEAEYDGVVYNALSSPIYGFLQGSLGLPTYIGDVDDDCGITTGFHTLPNYKFNPSTLVYDTNGTTQIVNIFPSQVQTTINNPGECVFVIPKTSINPSSLTITVFSPCSSAFTLDVSCPTVLPIFYGGQGSSLPSQACEFQDTIAYYSAPVNGNGTILGLFDWVFLDVNGEFHAPDGYYYAPTALTPPYEWFRLENGVIVEFGECGYNNFIIERCADGLQLVADSSITGINVGDFVNISDPFYGGCVFQVMSYTATTNTVTIDTEVAISSCEEVCVSYKVDNFTLDTYTVNYNDCAGAPQTTTVNGSDIIYVCARVNSVVVVGEPAGVVVSLESCTC